MEEVNVHERVTQQQPTLPLVSKNMKLSCVEFKFESHLSCRDAHRDPLDSMDLLLELLVDLSELVDLQYV